MERPTKTTAAQTEESKMFNFAIAIGNHALEAMSNQDKVETEAAPEVKKMSNKELKQAIAKEVNAQVVQVYKAGKGKSEVRIIRGGKSFEELRDIVAKYATVIEYANEIDIMDNDRVDSLIATVEA